MTLCLSETSVENKMLVHLHLIKTASGDFQLFEADEQQVFSKVTMEYKGSEIHDNESQSKLLNVRRKRHVFTLVGTFGI